MSHAKQILNHLQRGKTINGLEALNLFGCFRLPARIHDLRGEGYSIDSYDKKLPSGKIVAEYALRKAS